MAFGIPGSEDTGASGQFLGRLQYDTRVGFWKMVKRIQTAEGWEDEVSEPFKNPTFLLDIFSLEVGYIKFASPPSFMVVPYGTQIPARPTEKMTNDDGKERSAFLPGFRCKVFNPKMFGDNAAYHFANNSKTVMNPMDELYSICIATAEARAGKVPLVKVTGTTAIKVEGPRGSNTYYAPVFTVASWHARPEVFGAETVLLSVIGGSVAPVKPAAQQVAEASAWQAHARGIPLPTADAVQKAAYANSRHVGPPSSPDEFGPHSPFASNGQPWTCAGYG